MVAVAVPMQSGAAGLGWLVVTGRSRESRMTLVTQSMRVVLITLAATTFTFMGQDISDLLGNTLPRAITGLVTVNEVSPAEQIDKNLSYMQCPFAVLAGFANAGTSVEAWKGELSHVANMSAIGTAGPAVVGGATLLMYKVALALFVGLGPLFIMCLLFQSTKSLFSKWLQYGVGTCFSLAVLCFMVSVAMKMVAAVGAAMFVKYTLAVNGTGAMEGMNTIAMQQGGLGLVLTVLLVTCPPLAAQFFNATVGGFSSYSQFGHTEPTSSGGGNNAVRDAQGNVIGQERPSGAINNKVSDQVKHQPLYAAQTTGYQDSIKQQSAQISQKQFKVDGEPK